MKSVIYIDAPKEQEEKPVEFTEHLNSKYGWGPAFCTPENYETVVYLGRCSANGDMFAARNVGGCINIYKGHLNSGKY